MVRRQRLEQRLTVSQGERISEERLLEVLSDAQALQSIDHKTQDSRLLEAAARAVSEDEGYSIDTVHQVAEELSIPSEYVQRALALNHVDVEQQMKMQREAQVVSSPKGMLNNYVDALLPVLQSGMPLVKLGFELTRERQKSFQDPDDVLYFYACRQEKYTKKFLWWKRTKEKTVRTRLARVVAKKFLDGIKVRFTIDDPIVLQLCKPTIDRLTRTYLDGYDPIKIETHYSTERYR